MSNVDATEPNELDAPMKPLKITCTSVDCEQDLHCFLPLRRMSAEEVGGCRACGRHMVDWRRVGARDPSDARFTFEELRKELIRNHMWNVPFDQKALDLVARRGRIDTYSRIGRRLKSSVGKAAGRSTRGRRRWPGTSSSTPSTPPRPAAGNAWGIGTASTPALPWTTTSSLTAASL